MDNHDNHAQGHEEHHGLSPAQYGGVLLFLLAMTGLTYYTGKFVNLPGAWNLILALIIATTKATVVCLFFMHLWGDTRVNQLLVLGAVLFTLIMIGFTILDIQTRYPLAAPPGSVRSLEPKGNSLN